MTTTDLVHVPVAALRLADSCDACGYYADANSAGQEYSDRISQAFVRVTFPNGHELLFCGHHYAAHELTLATYGVTVHDERAALNVKPGVSA